MQVNVEKGINNNALDLMGMSRLVAIVSYCTASGVGPVVPNVHRGGLPPKNPRRFNIIIMMPLSGY